ncbi:glycine cleavage system aminomethyltransferase GcvT [Methylocystis bryophila]|uniref:aminomethyltransferase n=1 Tax=Methylocystis bryophila TaxID=655015 RepID=A0A1W6MRI5_9HYPH|nr:glycine cleavage system aminomethyltransferase GcvT [Methylocystis bryophila]ARN80208.1 glycine cleavage system protein T [Methylocystis bryophila]BDV40158.1 aminomethyltransferase [Methylocystis bryophila]
MVEALRRTPLHALHLELGARMGPFAGYDMPIQYPAGVLKEHLHTRASAGLFDVSHMGQLWLRAKSGRYDDLALALETLVPIDLLGLAPGRQRYGFLTCENGGISDDLMIARYDDSVLIICNAARKAEDEASLRARLSDACEIDTIERGLIALQGPRAAEALLGLAPEVGDMRFMDARETVIRCAASYVTRSGYTGEDGFEISVPLEKTEEIAKALLAAEGVAPIGLGARDSLRLEAGLCLYGADLDEATTPIEADLAWAIPKARRRGGARAGGFPGAETILAELEAGPKCLRVGLKPKGRAPVRAGAGVYADETDAAPVGRVTSGGFSPSLDAPISMGYLPASLATPGTSVFLELRGQRAPAEVLAFPFVPHHYRRA